MTLAELAEASGVPARTIRFYISRGLLDGPVKAGRGAAYTGGHLDRLERIKTLQNAGRTLSEIVPILGGMEAVPAGTPVAWWHHAIGKDVLVQVRSDMSPWRIRQVRAAIEQFARSIQTSGIHPEKEQ